MPEFSCEVSDSCRTGGSSSLSSENSSPCKICFLRVGEEFGRVGEVEVVVRVEVDGVRIALLARVGARLWIDGDGTILLEGTGGEAFLANHLPRLTLEIVLWTVFVPTSKFSSAYKSSAADSVTATSGWGSTSSSGKSKSRAENFRPRRSTERSAVLSAGFNGALLTSPSSESASPPSVFQPPDGLSRPGSAGGETRVVFSGTPPRKRTSQFGHLAGL